MSLKPSIIFKHNCKMMKAEYLILNLFIFIGPLLLSFDRKVRFVRHWPNVFLSLGLVMIPFLIWDALVTGIHWHFNEQFTLPIRIFGLPPGEWLFFITVPFACLFVWQIIVTRRDATRGTYGKWLILIATASMVTGIYFSIQGKLYTALVGISLALTILLDQLMGTRVLLQPKRMGRFMLILTALILVFNGYLTARPVVVYHTLHMTGLRIWTIPIEDFGYGYVLILLNIIIFEKLKGAARD